MKNLKFQSFTITGTHDCRTFTKGDMRKPGGWPGGIDPYPGKAMNEIVSQRIWNVRETFKGDVIGDPPKSGDRFRPPQCDHVFTVTNIEPTIGGLAIVHAVWFKQDPGVSA